ncbi:MAG: class I tRNA ligase family protein, partial [Candidatus Omnitrophota bacterium]
PENSNADLCVSFKEEKFEIVNRWIISRFYSTLKKTEEDLAAYKFNEAANNLYSFFWHEFCDWYLELIKPQITQKHTQLIMYKVLEKTLRMAHPFMPFISEEIWQRLPKAQGSIMQQHWPHMQADLINENDEKQMQVVFDIINTIRNMRAEMEVGLTSRPEIKLTFADKRMEESLLPLFDHVKNLAKLDKLSIAETYLPQPNEYACILKNMHIVMPLKGIVNVEEQINKNQGKINKINSEIKNKEAMLANENFLSRAPKEIIDAERSKLRDMHEQAIKLEVIKNGLR